MVFKESLVFKFPNETNGINKEISEADILKTLKGFELLIDKTKKQESNALFNQFKERIKDTDIFSFKIYFVSFNDGIEANSQKELVENFAENFKKDYGSELLINIHNKSIISNIYEKMNRKNDLEVSLSYQQMLPAYDIDSKNIKSYVGLVNGQALIKAIERNIETIFDENIRLYEGSTNVNNSIKSTASDSEESEMFYFYNNGVTIICDKVNNSPNKLSITLKGVSIVNGCQTVTSLYDLYIQKKLENNVGILTRIIEISDYNERMKITEYLNSQNPIKYSYFIANHTIIRDLQETLENKGYYLERQINEFDYKKHYGKKEFKNLVPLKLESVIQHYVGYWLDEYASTAKRGKGLLFDKNKIDEILMDINADRVIEANNMYENISKIITSYRRTRRNENKEEISTFLNMDHKDFLTVIDEYLFINTGDIVILNTVKLLKDSYKNKNIEFNDDILIKDAIDLIHNIIMNTDPKEVKNISALTKNSNFFKKIKQSIN